jgi:hypothetical protein
MTIHVEKAPPCGLEPGAYRGVVAGGRRTGGRQYLLVKVEKIEKRRKRGKGRKGHRARHRDKLRREAAEGTET